MAKEATPKSRPEHPTRLPPHSVVKGRHATCSSLKAAACSSSQTAYSYSYSQLRVKSFPNLRSTLSGALVQLLLHSNCKALVNSVHEAHVSNGSVYIAPPVRQMQQHPLYPCCRRLHCSPRQQEGHGHAYHKAERRGAGLPSARRVPIKTKRTLDSRYTRLRRSTWHLQYQNTQRMPILLQT